MVQWRNTNDPIQKFLRVFLMGSTRSGKTLGASTFPRPIFIVPPSEDSWKSLTGMGFPYVVLGETNPKQVLTDLRSVLDAMKVAAGEAHAKKNPALFHERFGETVVVESLSHLGDAILTQITDSGRVQADRATWGVIRAHLLNLRDVVFSFPAHVVFTALTQIKTDEKGNVVSAGPRISGQAAELIPSSCDLVGITEQTAGVPPRWQVHFQRFGPYDGGSRLRGMGACSMVCGDGKTTASLWQQLEPFTR